MTYFFLSPSTEEYPDFFDEYWNDESTPQMKSKWITFVQ